MVFFLELPDCLWVAAIAHGAWQPEDFRPYLDVVIAAFGEDRLMFGSDWPVCLLAADYGRVVGLVGDYAAQFTAAAQAKLFGGNAAKFYLNR